MKFWKGDGERKLSLCFKVAVVEKYVEGVQRV